MLLFLFLLTFTKLPAVIGIEILDYCFSFTPRTWLKIAIKRTIQSFQELFESFNVSFQCNNRNKVLFC